MLARYGVSMQDAQEWLASAIGGESIGRAVEGRERYPIALRTEQSWRDSPEALMALPVVTPSGAQVPLGSLAEIKLSDGPPMIRSEDAQLATYVFVDLSDEDLGGYIQRAEKAIRADAQLTKGVSWHWAGSYEFLQRASERLRLAVPLTLLIVFALLYAAFQRVAEASIIMLTVPFALVGGLWLLWLLGYAFSVAVAVGFIALAGVAAEFGVVMLIYLDNAVKRARASGELKDIKALDDALTDGALRRVRPKAMTVITIIAGLLPIVIATGAGAATMQRIAAPMLGGMLSAPLLSLIVIPAIYKLWLSRGLKSATGDLP
jgi:Cu(I)/Ag(I) efflux system membrane protein CusA/SilA